MSMMCRQCEQTAKGEGCSVQGVCGKSPETAALQDLLIHALKSIAIYGKIGQELGVKDKATDLFIIEALFTTVTNVNFDSQSIADLIREAYDVKERLKELVLTEYKSKNGKEYDGALPDIVNWKPAATVEELITEGTSISLIANASVDQDIQSLREVLLYGLKGMAAYADHALILGEEDAGVNAFFTKGLYALVDDSLSVADLVALNMEFGQANLKCMEILDKAHTTALGHPVPTEVNLGVKKGPAIIVTGHDLHDLKQLLEQTKGTGVNVYTHSEMLPAFGYPELNKYEHLAGHFGTAWQNQAKEFDGIPAAILFTTNCIQTPKESYKDNVFTTGLVRWPDVAHVEGAEGKKDFSAVIEKAKKLGGFSQDNIEKKITVGFAHNTVLSLAGQVIDAVKSKAVRHFFLIGGCDGAKPGRNYYTEFAQKVPEDCIILTLACGKFRFNRLDFGNIGPFPRLLDCGQCNDAYSAIKIAVALAEAFECGVNDLPLSLVLSWYEQKAVCILLTLLSLGIKDIRIGPSLPAFVSPNVLDVLVKNFDLKPISTPEEDLKAILQ